jgi:Transcription termination factor
MDLTDHSYDWVIPGMLERQERFMLIAPEKAGKTVLTRQVALTLASGRHPFHIRQEVPMMRTLLVDLENPAGVARRDFRRQVVSMEDVWSTDNQCAYVLHRPAGIHLGDPQDRAMLRQCVDRLHIDLLCISPIYKAYDGLDQSWEEQAFGGRSRWTNSGRTSTSPFGWNTTPPGGSGVHVNSGPSVRHGGAVAGLPGRPHPRVPHPPFMAMTWRAIRRDERKMAPKRLLRSSSGASWVPEWEDGENGFTLAMDFATH